MYSPQVLAVLVRDRHGSIRRDRRALRRERMRRRIAAAVYAVAKAVTVLAVVIDDDALQCARERAR